MGFGEFTMTVVEALIGLIFLVGLVEGFVHFITRWLLKLRPRTEEMLGYGLSILFGFLLAFSADYHFLGYFGLEFKPYYMNWIISGAIIGAGTGFVQKKFDLMNLIPHIVSGIKIASQGKPPENNYPQTDEEYYAEMQKGGE